MKGLEELNWVLIGILVLVVLLVIIYLIVTNQNFLDFILGLKFPKFWK